jgi:hypothetical protein
MPHNHFTRDAIAITPHSHSLKGEGWKSLRPRLSGSPIRNLDNDRTVECFRGTLNSDEQ